MQKDYEPIVEHFDNPTSQGTIPASMVANATEMLDAQSGNDSCLTGAERT